MRRRLFLPLLLLTVLIIGCGKTTCNKLRFQEIGDGHVQVYDGSNWFVNETAWSSDKKSVKIETNASGQIQTISLFVVDSCKVTHMTAKITLEEDGSWNRAFMDGDDDSDITAKKWAKKYSQYYDDRFKNSKDEDMWNAILPLFP